MSALGHEQTSRNVPVMSVIPLKADIHQREWHVHYVPLADVGVRALLPVPLSHFGTWRDRFSIRPRGGIAMAGTSSLIS